MRPGQRNTNRPQCLRSRTHPDNPCHGSTCRATNQENHMDIVYLISGALGLANNALVLGANLANLGSAFL
jgi:hypothetical protein